MQVTLALHQKGCDAPSVQSPSALFGTMEINNRGDSLQWISARILSVADGGA